MYAPPTGLEFRQIAIPTSIESPDAADFIEMVRVRNLVYLEMNGHDDERIAPEELLPAMQRTDYEIRLVWLAVQDGETIGRVGVDIPLEEDSKVVFWRIELLRSSWGRGVGTAGHALVERVAREHGRTVLQSWTSHPDAPGPRLSPPTGFGSIPDDHAARFYRRHGYSLEQVERNSALDIHEALPRLRDLHAEALAASGDYRIVQWFLPTPPEFVAGYGWMKSRMITDAPAAAMEFDEEEWDAARLRRHEAIYLDAGRPMQVTAAQHIATGELCAFNELVIGSDLTEATHQEDTLVLAEHRGHRLGLLVKCAALLAWRDFAPDSPRVLTYNAEENRPMLDINEAMGFVPIAYGGAWKKVLDA
ncbi:GNAT family N-acetyltransferase [Microbacterium rhizomatis]|uniref:GNAT family N-acetyltransferase n=1 Tax=Microbacterium rhizomatis TaxID=1631477 RepID=A0A5J5J721_9MICO|nr:GNAT family N-acetyltransferase [Microbacterium rhizomatis]KAA9110785.1 GNAT family N-acetyltransferase [Microbacterium rhizomatis]